MADQDFAPAERRSAPAAFQSGDLAPAALDLAKHALPVPPAQLLGTDHHLSPSIDRPRHQPAAGPATARPVISMIVPAYNEERRLPPTLREMIDFFEARREPYEIIVVDDGSADRTAAVVEEFQTRCPHLRLYRVSPNRGKGNAVRQGALLAQGRYIVFSDADGSTPVTEIDRLRRAIDDGAQLAIGSRALHAEGTAVHNNPIRKVLGRAFCYSVNVLLLPGISDTQCGFKMFSAQAARFLFDHQTAERFSFDLEILLLARRARLPLAQVPINWHFVPGSKVNLLLDSIKMFKDLFVFRWKHRRVNPADFARTQKTAPQLP